MSQTLPLPRVHAVLVRKFGPGPVKLSQQRAQHVLDQYHPDMFRILHLSHGSELIVIEAEYRFTTPGEAILWLVLDLEDLYEDGLTVLTQYAQQVPYGPMDNLDTPVETAEDNAPPQAVSLNLPTPDKHN